VSPIVVAVDAQWLTDPGVGSAMPAVAPHRSPVWTHGLVPAGSAQTVRMNGVHGTERGGHQGDERAWPLGYASRDALSAYEAAGQDVPGVALVLLRAGRADRGAAVAAAYVGDPVELLGRPVELPDFSGGRVDQLGRAGRSRTGRAQSRARFPASPWPARASSAASGVSTPLTSREGATRLLRPCRAAHPAWRMRLLLDEESRHLGRHNAETRPTEDAADGSDSCQCRGCSMSLPLARVGDPTPRANAHQFVSLKLSATTRLPRPTDTTKGRRTDLWKTS
jgi:hypothetical protein